MHREGAWKNGSTITHSLIGRRVGIHGFGAISQKLVPMLRPFTDRIQTCSPSVPDEILARFGVSRVHTLEELFSTSEVLVELAAATPQNHHLVQESAATLHWGGSGFRCVGHRFSLLLSQRHVNLESGR